MGGSCSSENKEDNGFEGWGCGVGVGKEGRRRWGNGERRSSHLPGRCVLPAKSAADFGHTCVLPLAPWMRSCRAAKGKRPGRQGRRGVVVFFSRKKRDGALPSSSAAGVGGPEMKQRAGMRQDGSPKCKLGNNASCLCNVCGWMRESCVSCDGSERGKKQAKNDCVTYFSGSPGSLILLVCVCKS